MEVQMFKINNHSQLILSILVIVTLSLVVLPLAIPKPVQASVDSPQIACDGYVCFDITQDPRVMGCIAVGNGNAWSCTNYCYKKNGKGYCAGVQQCVVGCN
jgi:hypothetical protein